MPKAILEFNLPEEREEFELAQKAVQYSKNCFYSFGADEHLKELESILEGR